MATEAQTPRGSRRGMQAQTWCRWVLNPVPEGLLGTGHMWARAGAGSCAPWAHTAERPHWATLRDAAWECCGMAAGIVSEPWRQQAHVPGPARTLLPLPPCLCIRESGPSRLHFEGGCRGKKGGKAEKPCLKRKVLWRSTWFTFLSGHFYLQVMGLWGSDACDWRLNLVCVCPRKGGCVVRRILLHTGCSTVSAVLSSVIAPALTTMWQHSHQGPVRPCKPGTLNTYWHHFGFCKFIFHGIAGRIHLKHESGESCMKSHIWNPLPASFLICSGAFRPPHAVPADLLVAQRLAGIHAPGQLLWMKNKSHTSRLHCGPERVSSPHQDFLPHTVT